MAAIMADEEDGVKMDDRLIILKESLSFRRRTAAFGKLSMLEVFVTTSNAFSMLDRSLKPVKGFSLVDSDCLLLDLEYNKHSFAGWGAEWEKMVALSKRLVFNLDSSLPLNLYFKKGMFGLPRLPFIFLFRGFVYEV